MPCASRDVVANLVSSDNACADCVAIVSSTVWVSHGASVIACRISVVARSRSWASASCSRASPYTWRSRSISPAWDSARVVVWVILPGSVLPEPAGVNSVGLQGGDHAGVAGCSVASGMSSRASAMARSRDMAWPSA